MEQAQDRIAVLDRVLEIVRLEIEIAGDRLEDPEAGRVEGGEQLEEGLPEARHLRSATGWPPSARRSDGLPEARGRHARIP
jgi:hypothetical protein